MRLTLDPQADAAYVYVFDQPQAVKRSKELDEQRVLDYNETNDVVGIEFLGVSQGVDLRGLPFREQLSKLFSDHNIREYA
jgi:uncharacterized protein YuzE